MPKVKFLQDFQGRETRGVFYKKDEVVELDSSLTDRLVADGRAELVKEIVNVYKAGGEVKVVENDLVYFDNEPQFESAAEPPKPPKKRGRK